MTKSTSSIQSKLRFLKLLKKRKKVNRNAKIERRKVKIVNMDKVLMMERWSINSSNTQNCAKNTI